MYHEIRIEKGRIKNYLVQNRREGNKWIKKSKFIGYGKLSSQKINLRKKEFELELKLNKKCFYLTKEEVLEVEKLRQIYFEKISQFKKEELDIFETSFFTELTYNSNSIEGNSLSLEETSLIINENLVPAGKTLREVYEAKNHFKAVKFLREYYGDINERMILKLQALILENISENFAGRYREGTVRIFGSNVKFPDAAEVPQLIKNLIFWYNKQKKNYHSFELAVVFSTKLVSIHPFVDGNGRISRLIMNFILQKNKYPWINVYTRQRAEYLQAIRRGNEEDYSLSLKFMIKSLRENLESYGFNK